ncbi:PAS domain S-box protein [candidate division WOR-3 bacterium]|nr:PAS domain S-box protein [candidate division WOR-3 bacterium]
MDRNVKIAADDLIKYNPSAIIAASPEGKIVYANLAFIKLTGYSKDEMLKKTRLTALLPEKNINSIIKTNTKTLESNIPAQLVSLVKKDGKTEECIAEISFSEFKKKKTTFFLFSKINDVDEIIFKSVETRRKRGEGSYEVFRELVRKINPPLLKIETHFKTMTLERKYSEPEFKDAFNAVDEAIKTVNRKIRYLFSIGNFSSDCYDILDLAEIADELRVYYKNIYKKVLIKIFIKKKPVKIRGVKELMMTAVRNICDNSIEAMKAEGVIEITISSGKKSVYLGIKDTGGGIREDVFANLFNSITTKKKGFGLGLKDSLEIAQLFSGELSAENFPGEGALFNFNFPSIENVS